MVRASFLPGSSRAGDGKGPCCLRELPGEERGSGGSPSERPGPVDTLSKVNDGSAFSKVWVLFQLDELQKRHHEANLAVTPLKVIWV